MRVAVIGAGIAGLVAAHRLGGLGHEVDVLERWPGLGGQAATFDLGDGHRLERYYHHLFTSDEEMAALCAELGVELEAWPSSVAMFAEGRLHPFTTPLDLLRYRPLSPVARVRLGLAALLVQRRHHDVAPFEDVTIRAWAERVMGREAYAKVWGPLLRGKFGERADEVGMSWLWSKLRTRRQMRGEEARQERLLYPRGSFEAISLALERSIQARGGRVRIDCPAARVERSDDGAFLVTPAPADSFRRGLDPRDFAATEEPERFDAVLATVPNDVFAQVLGDDLAAQVGEDYHRRLSAIEYYAALCLVLELDRGFHPYYWTNIAEPGVPFIGLIEQTNLVPPERYGGRRLLYVANYLPAGHELLGLSGEELLDAYAPGLRAVTPGFERSWVKRLWRFAEPAGQPVVLPGHRARMPSLDTGVPGLVLANTTQVYPEDRGTNYAVRLAGDAVAALLAQPVPALVG